MKKIILCILFIFIFYICICGCNNNETIQQSVIGSVHDPVHIYIPQSTNAWNHIIKFKMIETPKPTSTPTKEVFTITAYDLSIQCCGKSIRHREYGLTARGDSIRWKTRKDAMAVAVDPRFISLGSTIKIEFIDKKYQKYNGIYIAIDTGSAVKGKVIDLFMGDFRRKYPAKETNEFGSTKANITILSIGEN